MQKYHGIISIITAFLLFAIPQEVFAKQPVKPVKIASYSDLDDEFEDFESTQNEIKIYDPLEKMNRKIYGFNDVFDRYIFRHVAIGYRNAVPNLARRSIRNFITNISLPISAFNSILQGKVDNSLATFSHFLINSTIGIGGLIDVAGDKNIQYRHEDFGQTLGHYGLDSGAYLMLPFLGPSSLRDFGGWAADKAVNPTDLGLIQMNGQGYLIDSDYRFGLSLISAVDKRESLLNILDEVRQDSFDPYATIRSAYLQKRKSDISN
jgi:phospholipid-binding lipoprotein MlaA